MKNTFSGILLGVLLLVGVGMARAQMDNDVVNVKVPFAFNVGVQSFPAGEYSLKPLLPNTMLLRDEAGRTVTNIAMHSVQSSEVQKTAKLVFNGYAGRYFLAQVWRANDNIGGELARSTAETEVAKKYVPARQIALKVVARR